MDGIGFNANVNAITIFQKRHEAISDRRLKKEEEEEEKSSQHLLLMAITPLPIPIQVEMHGK